MARIETWFDQDLKNPVPVRVLTGSAFSLDNLGNLIGVRVTDGGEIITLAGSVTGYCMLADGQTVTVAGSRSGNMASIILPQTAYTVPGPIRISIKLTEGSAITTLLACVGTVVRTQTGNIVNPGSVVQDWSTQISAQLQACQDAADNMGAMVAVAFDPSSRYVVGTYVIKAGSLYRLTADHEAGTTWENTSKTQVPGGVMGEVSNLKQALDDVREETRNLWQNGDIQITSGGTLDGFTQFLLNKPLPAGTYVISGFASSDNTEYNVLRLRFSTSTIPAITSSNVIADVYFNKSTDRAFNKFTLPETAYSIRIMTAGTQNECAGHTGSMTFVQVEAGNHATDYVAPFTAIDVSSRALGEENRQTIGTISSDLSEVTDNLTKAEFVQNYITEATKNLWQNGDIQITSGGTLDGFTQFLLGKPLQAGTYVISGLASSDNTDYNVLLVRFSTSQIPEISTQNIIADVYFNKSESRIYKQFTLPETAYSVRIMTAVTLDDCSGHTGALRVVQIESGTSGTEYVPPFTATDIVARNEINLADNDIVVYSGFEDGYIDTSGEKVSSTAVSADFYYHKIIDCKPGDAFIIEACGGSNTRLQHVFTDSSLNVLSKSATMSENWATQIKFFPESHIIAPANARFLFVNHHYMTSSSYVTPRVYKLSSYALANHIATYITGELPYVFTPDWKRFVIATYHNLIAIYQSNKIYVSQDCGKTWNSGMNISAVGTIHRAYFFANGALAFYTGTKAYYSDDWLSYQEAIVYEADGQTIYTPNVETNFETYWARYERKYVNDVDMYVFGSYDLNDGNRIILWYTLDRGKTYKVAYEFNIPGHYNVRHIHDCIYYEPDDVFIVGTGDANATECYVFKFRYNATDDTWSIELVGGSARNFKWSGMALWNGELYYTNDNTPGSVWKTTYENIADLSKHECIFSGGYCDPILIAFGTHGDMLITQTNVRNLGGADVPIPFDPHCAASIVYYSQDRKNFAEIPVPIQMIKGQTSFSHIQPITDDGQQFVGMLNTDTHLPSLPIDEIIKLAGYKRAFLPKF